MSIESELQDHLRSYAEIEETLLLLSESVKNSTSKDEISQLQQQKQEFIALRNHLEPIIKSTQQKLKLLQNVDENKEEKKRKQEEEYEEYEEEESDEDIFADPDKPKKKVIKKRKKVQVVTQSIPNQSQERFKEEEEEENEQEEEISSVIQEEDVIVDIQGNNAPQPINSFEQVFEGAVMQNIVRSGFKNPTAVQRYAIPSVLAKRDIIAIAKTGFRPVVIYGGVDYSKQAKDVDLGCDVLIATPGRLLDMLAHQKISLAAVRYLCLDEADRMLDMGFEKDIRAIVQQKDLPKDHHTVMFSATFPVIIQRLARDFLKNEILLKVGKTGTTKSITHKLKYVAERDKEKTLFTELKTVPGLTVVFVERKSEANTVCEALQKRGILCTTIHGDRSQSEREAALKSFRDGKTPVLVATDVAARGLDIPNVSHVINYDLPDFVDDYIHRVGRTGRAGNTGLATSFFNHRDKKIFYDLEKLLKEMNQPIPQEFYKVKQETSAAIGPSVPPQRQ